MVINNDAHEAQGENREIILAMTRAAMLRVKLLAVEIEEIGVYLNSGAIDDDQAIAWLHEVGAAPFCILPPTIESTARVVAS